jgi:hypothetical protein
MNYDFDTCVKIADKIYCWDRGLESMVILEAKPVAFSECPDSAIKAVMKRLADKSRG